MSQNDIAPSYGMTRRWLLSWRLLVWIGVGGYIALAAATHTIRPYYLLLVLVVPGTVLAGERGRQFFLDWAPMLAYWLAYDRLRLLQPFIQKHVLVGVPYRLELFLFVWLGNGDVPAHTAYAFLAARQNSIFWVAINGMAQIIYFSHVFGYPLILFYWWQRGHRHPMDRERFVDFVRAYTVLNILGLAAYIFLPVAPPWWVTLHGEAIPTPNLVAGTNPSLAMTGTIIQRMVATSPHWFAAMPSLHGGYAVLLCLLAFRAGRLKYIVISLAFCICMWTATVILNQHYIIDLIAGGAIAFFADYVTRPRRH